MWIIRKEGEIVTFMKHYNYINGFYGYIWKDVRAKIIYFNRSKCS